MRSADLLTQITAAGLPEPTREFRFHEARKWRWDLCWLPQMVALEIDGGGWIPGGGRHHRARGFENDAEKINTGILMGWRVLRATPAHIKSGQALAWLEEALR